MLYYFVSDVHLGLNNYSIDKNEVENRFVSWLKKIEIELLEHQVGERGLYIIGDLFDFWYEYSYVVPKGFTSVIAQFKSMTANNIEVFIMEGNHDSWYRDYLSNEAGVTLCKEKEILIKKGEKKLMMSHGDKWLIKDNLRLKIMYSIFNNQRIKTLFSWLIHPDIAIKFGEWWSQSNRQSKPIEHIFKGENDKTVIYARDILSKNSDNIDYFIIGHLHTPILYALNDNSNLIVLGHWITENPIVGVYDGKEIHLEKL